MDTTAQILVVDHNPSRLGDTARLLAQARYSVAEAATGKDALRLARVQRPELILLDVELPDMDGIEVCRRIKSDPACQGCFVVLMHAQSTPGHNADAGADEKIDLPVDDQDLLARVRALLRVRRAEQALRAEQGLHESQEGYRVISELTSDIAYCFRVEPGGDLAPTVEWMTGPLAERLGFGPQPETSAWIDAVHPEDRPAALARLQSTTSGISDTSELRVIASAGETRWLRVYSRPGWDEAKQRVVRIYGAAQDITEHRLAQEHMQHARDELEATLMERTRALDRANQAQQARAEELGVLNTVSHMVSTSLSLDRVAEAAIEGIVSYVAPDLAMLYLREGDALHLLKMHASHPGLDREPYTAHRVGECLCGLAADQGKPCYLRDIHLDPRCTLDECKQAGFRSFAALPLLSGEHVLGVLGVASRTERRFEDQRAFWEALAGEVAMGIRNARLHQEVQHHVVALEQQVAERIEAEEALRARNRDLVLLNRAAQVFNSSLDSGQVLIVILEAVRHLLDVAACSVWLVDPEEEQLVCKQATGKGSEVVRGLYLRQDQGIAGWVARHGQSLIVQDTQVDDRHFKDVDRLTGVDLISVLAVALHGKERIIGVLEVLDTAPDRFVQADVTLLELLAVSAANAIEHAQLYERLERARHEWEEIFQGVGHPTLILAPDHTIVSANRAALRALHKAGSAEESPLGKKCHQAFQCTGEQAQHCPLPDMFTAGRPTTAEIEMEALGGTFLVSCTPVLDREGHLQQIIHVATDITDLKRAEQSLRVSQLALERSNQELTVLNAVVTTIGQSLSLQQVLDGVLDRLLALTHIDAGWISLLDEDSSALSLAAYRGFLPEAVDNLRVLASDHRWAKRVFAAGQPVVVTEDALDAGIAIESLTAKGPFVWTSTPIQSRDRVLGVLSVLSTPSQGASLQGGQLLVAIGRQIGVAVESHRLREEAAEAQILRELSLLRSELIANASHELRTPLGLIRIFSSALLMDEVAIDSDTHHQFLAGIEDETVKLEGIVDNLLDLSRMEGGRLRLEVEPVDLGQLIENCVAAMAPEGAGHRLVSELDPRDGSLVATVDARRIEQVLRNLLSNAIKYSPDGGTITVQGQRSAKSISIWVRDQGIGIPKEEQSRIFERFYRVDNDTTRRTRGAGLGLSICKWIAEAHGGQILVQSDPRKAQGSAFCLVVPTGDAGGRKA